MTLIDIFRDDTGLYLGVVGLVGLFVGSFLNVVIHRLPIMMERDWRAGLADLDESGESVSEDDRSPVDDGPTGAPSANLEGAGATMAGDTSAGTVDEPFNLAVPRSRCPRCDAPITAWQNVPVLSWLLLRGKCARCASPISARYPIVEIVTMILSVAVAWHFGPTSQAALGILVTWFLVAMTMIDYDHQLLPDDLTLSLMWIGLLASLLPVFADVRAAIIGAAAGYLVLWLVYQIFKFVTGKEGMGYGDFKLLAALGALFGWQALPTIILLSSLVGAGVGLVLIAVTRRSKEIPIPFGPYLAAAGWIVMLWGESLQRLYLDTLA